MRKLLTIVALGITLSATATYAGTLFIGSDRFVFNSLPSVLAKATVNGPNLVSQTNIPLSFPLNGIGDGPGFLFAGDPDSNTLRTVSYAGNLLSTVSAGFPSSCCNEEMQYFNGNFYHAHWSDMIQQIDPGNGNVIQTFSAPQDTDVVGMAVVGTQLWITHWGAREVGVWDPTTNIFTFKFSTPSNAGALAYDPQAGILWIGLEGGLVQPYDLTGAALGAGFSPFGAIGDTIDGLTFQGEAGAAPRVGAPVLSFCGIGLLGLLLFLLGWRGVMRSSAS
ncbi:MAG: YncE family protein [Candidatus Binatia bacterium]